MLGNLRKMKVELQNPIQYQLPLSKQFFALNAMIGKPLKLIYKGNIACVHCGNRIKKSFNQGFCYPCFSSLAQCDLCIIKPETCHYAEGTCRQPSWGEEFCFQPHIVYLANSSGIKVGITRQTQIPTRWIDQGAVQALPILKVKSRHIAGLLEVIIAQYISDKTNWQSMLKSQAKSLDLKAKLPELLELCKAQIDTIYKRFGKDAIKILGQSVVDIVFPVISYPSKIKSFNFDKNPEVSGILQGIKGQYLLFDTGVINIRKFSGYEVEIQS